MINYTMQEGCVHIYTGKAKGKTTASVGLAVRAKSRGLRVLFAQFMKGETEFGEIRLLKKLSIQTVKFPKILSPHFHPGIDRKKLRRHVDEALTRIKEIMDKGDFDMIILDEFNCLLYEKLLTEYKALDLIFHKPENLELILTGRGATEKLILAADYVTEMKLVRHPFLKGIRARKGIEF